jgi:hypothetical protein
MTRDPHPQFLPEAHAPSNGWTLNGKTKVALGSVGGFLLALLTISVPVLWALAQDRAEVMLTLRANQHALAVMRSRQTWVIRSLSMIAQKDGVQLPDLPPEPLDKP